MAKKPPTPVQTVLCRPGDKIPEGVKVLWAPHPGPQTEVLTRGEDEILLGGAKGGGKGLIKKELVLTPFGFRPIGDLGVGDQVTAADGSVSRILQVFQRGSQPTYRFTFIDGASLVVDGDHIWFGWRTGAHYKANRQMYGGDGDLQPIRGRLYSTEQLIGYYSKPRIPGPNQSIGNFIIPLCAPVPFTIGENGGRRPIDPYLLGLLLGDGSLLGQVSFSSADEEIVSYVRGLGFELLVDARGINYRFRGTDKSATLRASLKDLKLFGTHSWDKFVPYEYKYTSVDSRRLILAGLLDTDGYVDIRGHISFTSTSKQLAEDVQWLVRSLGGKATLTDGGIGKYRDRDGIIVECRNTWDVYIQIDNSRDIFRLSRKRNRCRDEFNGGISERGRRLTSIEELGEQETVCIKIDHPSGLFVARDFIVTHNTAAGIIWLIKGNYTATPTTRADVSYINHKNYRALVLRKNIIDLGDWIDKAKNIYEALGATFRERPLPLFEFPSGAKIILGHLDDSDTYTKYQGQEFQRFLLEEATLVPDLKSFLMVRSCVRSAYSEMRPQCLLTANPGGPGHSWIRDRYIKAKGPDGQFVPPKTVITEQIGRHTRTRIYIPARLSDNPTLQADPTYEANLMSLPEGERRAYLDGDWDALSGCYFTEYRPAGPLVGEPPEANHTITSRPLHPWLSRCMGMDWGYAHEGAVYWGCNNSDGRFHVYREMVHQKLGAEMWGVEIALASIEDLRGLELGHMNLFLSPDAWDKRNDTRTVAEQIQSGISKVLGTDSVLLLSADDMPDADFYERLQSQQKMGITIRKASNQRVAGAQYIRSLLRWWPAGKLDMEPFNQELFLRLLHVDSRRAMDYRDAYSIRRVEVLPGLLIHDCCPRVIQSLQSVVYDDAKPEDVLKQDGDDSYDAFRYLVFSNSVVKAKEPFKIFADRRMQEVRDSRGGELDGNTMVWAMRKAEADYKALDLDGSPIYIPRASGRRAKHLVQ